MAGVLQDCPPTCGRGAALENVDNWLRPLFMPIARWAFVCMSATEACMTTPRNPDIGDLFRAIGRRLNEYSPPERLDAEQGECVAKGRDWITWSVVCNAEDSTGRIWYACKTYHHVDHQCDSRVGRLRHWASPGGLPERSRSGKSANRWELEGWQTGRLQSLRTTEEILSP